MVDAPVLLVVQVPGHLHPCRGAEACSHGPWYAGRAGSSKSFARCVQRQVPSTAAVHRQGRHHPFRGAEAYPRDQAVLQTIEVPLFPYTRWLVSLFTDRANFHCRGAEADSHGLAVQQTIETPQLRVNNLVDALTCRSCTSSFSCRDAEADSHGLVDHGDSPAALRRGGYVPGVKVCELVGPCAQAQGQG